MGACYVGIDVSKDRLDGMPIQPGRFFQPPAMARASKNGGHAQRACARRVEATGAFETVVAALAGSSLPVVVVNPAQVRHFAQALGKRAKTDPIDAGVIAPFAEATKPEPRPLPDETTQLLADLVGRQRQIVEIMVAEGQRERSACKRASRACARRSKSRSSVTQCFSGFMFSAIPPA